MNMCIDDDSPRPLKHVEEVKNIIITRHRQMYGRIGVKYKAPYGANVKC